jgi:hypothetical protein
MENTHTKERKGGNSLDIYLVLIAIRKLLSLLNMALVSVIVLQYGFHFP